MEDACELGRRAIYHATFRDAVSGGTVSGASSAKWMIVCRVAGICSNCIH